MVKHRRLWNQIDLEGKLLAKIDTKISPILECTSLCNMLLYRLFSEGEVYGPTLDLGWPGDFL